MRANQRGGKLQTRKKNTERQNKVKHEGNTRRKRKKLRKTEKREHERKSGEEEKLVSETTETEKH